VVECKKPLRGDEIKVEQTKKEHLSFSFIEVFTAQGVEEEESEEGSYNVKPNTKAGLNKGSVKQSTNYSNTNYLPNWAFQGPNKFSHTKRGAGQWWEVSFNQDYWVDRVKILNRRDCCGGRLAKTDVYIGKEKCGQVEPGT